MVESSSAETILCDGKTAWRRFGDGFVDDRLLDAADRKWLEYGGGSAVGRILKVDSRLERANPSAPLEERCAAMGVTPEVRDAAALATGQSRRRAMRTPLKAVRWLFRAAFRWM